MYKIPLLFILVCLVILVGASCSEKNLNQNSPANQNLNTAVSENQNINTNLENQNKNSSLNTNINQAIEEPDITWTEIDNGKYLPVPFYFQKNVPTYGSYACGPTSLKMVLEYTETDKEVPAIYEMIQQIGVNSNVWQDTNVDDYFIAGFGITDVALKKLAVNLGYEDTIIFGKSFYPNHPASAAIDPTHQGQLVDSTDWRAQIDEEGWNTKKLYQTVNQGKPVIVDVTVGMDPLSGPDDARSYNPFYTEDGNQHWELAIGTGHFMVVVGWQNWGEENASIVLMDPLTKTGQQDHTSTYLLDTFEKSWILLNNQGLLIR